MVKLKVTCTYCNSIWIEKTYGDYSKEFIMCPKCKDSFNLNMKVLDETNNIDYYRGSSEFPRVNKPGNDYG